jgi:glycine cleavage system transcriptional repressor
MHATTHLLVSTLGRDKPGVVAAICSVLAKHDCNIEDSTMTRLHNEFATILYIALPEGSTAESITPLREELMALEEQLSCTVTVRAESLKALEASQAEQADTNELYLITVAGQDRTGITYEVSHLLAQHRVNIIDLQAKRIDGEDTPIYLLMLEVSLPKGVSPEQLRDALNPLERQLGLDIQLRPAEHTAL